MISCPRGESGHLLGQPVKSGDMPEEGVLLVVGSRVTGDGHHHRHAVACGVEAPFF